MGFEFWVEAWLDGLRSSEHRESPSMMAINTGTQIPAAQKRNFLLGFSSVELVLVFKYRRHQVETDKIGLLIHSPHYNLFWQHWRRKGIWGKQG
jgi:hypothetical protein